MSFRSRFVATVSAALLSAALLVPQAIAQETKPVIVFAAASLKNALDAISADWQKETGKSVKTSYAASSALAKQLEQDAPADIFISADLDWMNYVEKKALIDTASRANLLGNAIVLIAPKDSTATIELKEGADLGKLVGDGRLAAGQVTSVPAGKYAKAALEKLGLWSQVEGKLAQAESVRAALLLVSRGEAPLGIVYASDAVSDANVKVIATFPAASHPAIIYPIALTTKAGEDAKSFYTYVKSRKAAPHFEKQGFTVLADKKS
ncbi:molybdate ABC transporter substrate-binding protein [Rhodomicrobium sp. Az07]|uniref:molybdate ABC transporter substrate-binding protein n=1 Tax=Rhodomicrobium sp. Az07 TaxID=2839034 RepID=UPI001BEB4830|nr:molybdate ABC transporter substrate-binding protein [Rhodomicrobium sp. Az07]MBT3070892.1 molybdate ABC transporter substrate-binding protein [Rhodomicrobium sp. Az07]